MIIEANQPAFATLFGTAVAERLVEQVKAGIDPELDVPAPVLKAYALELELERKSLIPIPRTLMP